MSWHYVITDYYGWATPFGTEYTDNAQEIWNYLVGSGWTEQAAAGVLGNMQVESFLNPGQWEIGFNYSIARGTGLGQWTPATKVSNYVGSTNKDAMANGSLQMALLVSTPGQYITETQYITFLAPDGSSPYYGETGLPYLSTMAQYSQSTASVDDLTKLWAICWERPGATYYNNSIGDRKTYANYWYATFSGGPVPPTPPTPPTPADEDFFPILIYTQCIK